MKKESWAWTVPWFGGWVIAFLEPVLLDVANEGVAAGFFLAVGAGLGWAWYRLYPRPLAQRLAGFAFFGAFVGVLALVFGLVSMAGGNGASVEFGQMSPADLTAVGVLVGLVLAETRRTGGEWAHQRPTAMTSGKSMRDLR